MAPDPNLWGKAFNSLTPELQKALYPVKTHKRDVLATVLKEAEAKRALSLRKRWNFTKPNGDVIIVRDVLEKIMGWVQRFKDTGDIIVQYDPAHAALPWAAVRFLLQVSVSEVQLFAMADDLENISRIMVRYRLFEVLYLRGAQSELELKLEEALAGLYAEILVHLGIAIKFFEERSTVAPYYHHHQFIAQMRLPGAGQWLLSHEDYTQWQSSSSPSLLLLHGIPGSGKSTLCSVVVDSVLSIASTTPSAAPLAYFYCANPESEKARRSSDDTMRTILFQLCVNATHPTQMRDILSSEYERQRARSRAGKMDMPRLRTKDCVRLILELAEQDPMTIVIDGLDSVEDSERPDLIDALREIVSHADNVVKIFVTSRSSHRAAAMPIAEFQIQLTTQETRPDMEAFVEHSVDDAVARKLLLEGNLRPEIRRMLLHALLDGAGEMFLWVKLQLQRICRKTVEDDVVSALQDKLPEDIDQIYKESLVYILTSGDMARDIAVKVLSWVLYMREPLTPMALLGAATADEHSKFDLNQVMVLCANLVIMDAKCNIIRFAHQSVQDFLQRQEAFATASAHSLLASVCLDTCLRGPSTTFDLSLKIPSDGFYVYAAMYWPVHSEIALALDTETGSTNTLTHDVTTFIFDEEWETTLPFDSWISSIQEISRIIPKYHVMNPILEAIPGSEFGFLFLLSTFGLSDVLDTVLSNISELNVNIQNNIGHTPLYLAASFGHLKSIKTLVSRGANINVECGWYGSPLHVASFSGHLEVVDLLLQLGAISTCGSVFESVLQAAFRGGREDVSLFLVGVDSVLGSEDDKEKALQDAALMGFIRVVQKLQVELSGSSSSSKGKIDKIKRQITKAIQGGQVGVLRKFLDRNIENRGLIPPEAIAIATLHNHKSMVEFLLTQGINLEASGAFGTPLRTASLLNYESIARLLLDKGADMNACGPFGDALQAAALNGHVSTMRLLLQEGAKVNQRTGFYGSALQAAAYHGQADAVELLIDCKADAYQRGHSSDAFHAALEGGHPDVIALLLKKCRIYHETHLPTAACARSPFNYRNLLRDASPERRQLQGQAKGPREARLYEPWSTKQPIVKMETIFEIAFGESDITQSKFHELSHANLQLDSSLLDAAASCGHDETVKFLLEHQGGPNISNEKITRAIGIASENRHLNVIHAFANHYSNRKSVDKRVRDEFAWVSLELASEPFFAEENISLRNKLSSITKKTLRAKSGKESQLQDFTVCCERGDVGFATAILGTERHNLLSRDEAEGGLQLCAFHGTIYCFSSFWILRL
ncbi:ankyrin repeat domain-containing protein [Colletotrichum musicola]|uniref:Ankyrin repeat domain-containing protein n=1 Tax=Colletotrichum musicola TaxID=2175873 RepID=A0A8H6MUU5_9PEZI|nr:ankyrin repeat domain-containing protein [Colletotrichum musicola]